MSTQEPKPKQTDYPLSFSSDKLMLACARKYELYKLLNYEQLNKRTDTIHTTFGTAVGVGVASLMEDPDDLVGALDKCFRAWSPSGEIPLFEGIRGKSIVTAMVALESYQVKALDLRDSGWEIAYINGKPASEVSFKLILEGYGHYVGYMDNVMVHKASNTFMVVECKTMGRAFHPAIFQNSKQDVGYLVAAKTLAKFDAKVFYPVLTALTGGFSWSWNVYERTDKDFNEFHTSLLLSFQHIRLMDDYSCFPRNGQSCMGYGSLCPAYGECHKEIKYTEPKKQEHLPAPYDYDIVIHL